MILTQKWEFSAIDNFEKMHKASKMQKISLHFSPTFETNEHVFGHLEMHKEDIVRSLNEILLSLKTAVKVSADKFKIGAYIPKYLKKNLRNYYYINNSYLF